MANYRYYTDPDYPGLQWRYKLFPASVSHRGEVRQDGGPWIPATTTLLEQIVDTTHREVGSEG